MNPNSLKNLIHHFKKGHTKPKNAYSFSKGHKTNIGRKQSEEQKEKTRIFMTGNKFAIGSKGNKGKKWKVKDKTKMFGHIPWNKGVPCSDNTKNKISLKNKGKIRTLDQRKTLSIAKKKSGIKPPIQRGEKNVNWKGGITPENVKIRNSIEIDLWKRKCLERDMFTCQKTGQKGGKLVIHHILNFSSNPELRFDIDNGITLSKISHDNFHILYGKKNNTREQLLQFLNQI